MTTAVVNNPDPLTWLNLGVLGLLAAAAVRGLVWFQPAVKRMERDIDELKADNAKLNTFIREAAVPAVTTANGLSEKSTEAVRDAQELMRFLAEELKDRDRRRRYGEEDR